MDDRDCVALLQWALPQLGLRWDGFRNVRRQVCRRLVARARQLGLDDLSRYRARLEEDPAERRALDALCYVTISRFYRDRSVFDALRDVFLPELAASARAASPPRLRVWSAGCASGEEPYTVAIVWKTGLAARFSDVALEVLATDFDAAVLERARRATYEPSSLRELAPAWRDAAFEAADAGLDVEGARCPMRLREPFRAAVRFEQADVRRWTPDAPLHLVLCRNVAFTYFDRAAQADFLARVASVLVPGGLLVVGAHEVVPDEAWTLPASPFEPVRLPRSPASFYRRRPGAGS